MKKAKHHSILIIFFLCIFIVLILIQRKYDNPVPAQYSNHSSKTSTSAVPHPRPSYDNWPLVWEDDFSSNILDSTKWNVVDWAAQKNNELQYYSPKNVAVNDGYLELISLKENFGGRDYTSGAVETSNKFSFLYGKVDIRAKLPKGQGIFPAFWTLPSNGDNLPEIDIMEMIGSKPNEIWMVNHWLDSQGNYKKNYTSIVESDFSKDYHIYSIVWSPKKIEWLIDGNLKFTSYSSPNVPMYLYLNTAIGGDWPKNPDETTYFPQTLSIDYVRVYKYKDE